MHVGLIHCKHLHLTPLLCLFGRRSCLKPMIDLLNELSNRINFRFKSSANQQQNLLLLEFFDESFVRVEMI